MYVEFEEKEYKLCYQWREATEGALAGHPSDLGLCLEAYDSNDDGYSGLVDAIFEKYPALDENYEAVDKAIEAATSEAVDEFYRFSVKAAEEEAEEEADEKGESYLGDGVFLVRKDD